MLRPCARFLISCKASSSAAPKTVSPLREILRLAATDFPAARKQYDQFHVNNDIPDWGAIKMSSLAFASGSDETRFAENILRNHYEETGGSRRLARKSVVGDDQIEAALRRVLSSKNGGYDRARMWYKWMLEMKYCSNKDSFVSILVENTLKTRDLRAALNELDGLCQLGRVKSLTQSLLLLTEYAISVGTKEENELVMSVLSVRIPASKDWLCGYVLLKNGRGVEFAEQLHSNNKTLTIEGTRYIAQVASRTKSANVLSALLQLEVIFKLDSRCKSIVYENLIKILGKNADVDGMDKVLRCILEESDREVQVTNLQILRHFYKCLNRPTPAELLDAI